MVYAYSLFGVEYVKKCYVGWTVKETGVLWVAWFLPVFWVLFEPPKKPASKQAVSIGFKIGPVRERACSHKEDS